MDINMYYLIAYLFIFFLQKSRFSFFKKFKQFVRSNLTVEIDIYFINVYVTSNKYSLQILLSEYVDLTNSYKPIQIYMHIFLNLGLCITR